MIIKPQFISSMTSIVFPKMTLPDERAAKHDSYMRYTSCNSEIAFKAIQHNLHEISRLWAQNLRVLSTVQSCHNSLVRLDTLWDICPPVLLGR